MMCVPFGRLARKCLGWALIGVAFVGPAAGRARAADGISAEKLDAAINNAKKFIYTQQKAGGHWEKDAARIGTEHDFATEQGDCYGGYTALATYALLAAGESPNDPRIKEAVNFLKHCDMVGVYAIALRCQVWLLMPHASAEMQALIRKDADFLIHGINDGKLTPANRGLWDYLGRGPRVDHSVSQYGVLGLWACEQTGLLDVGNARWHTLEEPWRTQQAENGAWDYAISTGGGTLPMTAAGIASLFIIDDYLRADQGAACKGNAADPNIERGINYVDHNYNEIGLNCYTLYGIERIGMAGGIKYFGGHDWYNDLAGQLLAAQDKDGSWRQSQFVGGDPASNTALALLFLARGRSPVMANKLDYHHEKDLTAPWNERPRDLALLSTWIGHETEALLGWQVVGVGAPPEDLHDAPVLYLSGSGDINLTDDARQRVKAFVEQGGLLLGNADCDHPEFAKAFEDLGRSLFNREFRELPADHPIYTHEQFPAGSRWRRKPRVLGLSNEVRELMIMMASEDPARWWQVPHADRTHPEVFELGADLFEYACDRKFWSRGSSYFVAPNPAAAVTHKVKVARIELPNTSWDPEPGGWRQLAAVMHNHNGVDLSVFNAIPGKGALGAAQVAHLTGTTDFTLAPAAQLELQVFVKNGGTLVVDAAGGSAAFAAAAERELPKVFGAAAAQELEAALPRNHPLYTLAGSAIAKFEYRKWARDRRVGTLRDPRIRAITVGNRPAVFYSPEDLSAGLVGEPVDGVIGYDPETATAIMRNIILYSTEPKHGAAPASAPAR